MYACKLDALAWNKVCCEHEHTSTHAQMRTSKTREPRTRTHKVHAGDFLAFMTKDFYPACVHRVMRSSEERLSMPFLVRARGRHADERRL